MFELLFALTGVGFGALLSYIAPEELSLGKKYFIFLRNVLFFSITLFISFLLFEINLLFAISFLLIMIALFLLKVKLGNHLLEIPSYAIFILSYFFIDNFSLILVTLIFLYGFPVGTLVWQGKWARKKI